MPRRILVSQGDTLKSSVPTTGKRADVERSHCNFPLQSHLDKSLVEETEKAVSIINETHHEDASITPPNLGTVTNICEGNHKQYVDGRNQNNLTSCSKKSESHQAPVVEGSKKVQFLLESNATFQEMEWDTSNQADLSNAISTEPKNSTLQSMDMDESLRVDGVSSTFAVRLSGLQDQLHQFRNFLQSDGNHPMTQSSVCATSISVHATSAPILNSTTNCSSSRLDGALQAAGESMPDVSLPPQNLAHRDLGLQAHPSSMPNSSLVADRASNASEVLSSRVNIHCGVKEIQQDNRQRESVSSEDPSLLNNKLFKEKRYASMNIVQEPASKGASIDGKLDASKAEKPEKARSDKGAPAPRKKNYDPDLFFKVNGKLYQRLGKIGSGGSSEVHKVISSDCTIYALKKIKLKGRDYATAYGFCQEILYLNKLKGKNNIIQLIDYEVTDKALLQEVMDGSMANKDGRVKDDGYIYMVLEYGEIDLAHMLSQKWKEMENSNTSMDENWLRFYWQQILQAANTIHEERIVHSDLKPANFLLVKGSLKLIDFGIAKAIMSDTTNIQRESQVGTLSYMSPEAFMCNENDENGNIIKCGRPSDIWSLGCILYQMVYGRTPFSEYKTFWAKFKVITYPNHAITYEPVSNPWLLDIMKKCLAWDRKKRWRIPQLLQHPFLVPLGPAFHHPSTPQDQRYRAIQLIAESCADNQDASVICYQIQRLLYAKPESRDQQCKLLSQISEMCSQLKMEIARTS